MPNEKDRAGYGGKERIFHPQARCSLNLAQMFFWISFLSRSTLCIYRCVFLPSCRHNGSTTFEACHSCCRVYLLSSPEYSVLMYGSLLPLPLPLRLFPVDKDLGRRGESQQMRGNTHAERTCNNENRGGWGVILYFLRSRNFMFVAREEQGMSLKKRVRCSTCRIARYFACAMCASHKIDCITRRLVSWPPYHLQSTYCVHRKGKLNQNLQCVQNN